MSHNFLNEYFIDFLYKVVELVGWGSVINGPTLPSQANKYLYILRQIKKSNLSDTFLNYLRGRGYISNILDEDDQ